MEENELLVQLKELFNTQNLAVAATDMYGLPYTSLVAFVADPELKFVIFATYKNTKKFGNITRNNKISLLVDNRKNQISDFSDTIAVTIEGTATILNTNEKSSENLVEMYVHKHKYLDSFIKSPNCVLIRVNVEKYHFVNRFQNVHILVMKK